MFKKAIDRQTRQDLALLKKSVKLKDFYLAGGTAAALHLGHRCSYDLYFINQKKYSFKKCLHLYDKKYQLLETNKLHLIKSLSYFTDAESDPMPEMIKKVSWKEVKDFYKKEVLKLSKDYL